MAADVPCISRRSVLQGASATVALAAAGCATRRVQTSAYAPPPLGVSGNHSLRSVAAAHGLLVGFALSAAGLRDSEIYRRIAAEQCSIAVAENAMKWDALRPAADQFSFDVADAFVAFCESHHIKMRGHNLCWHESLPAWLMRIATAENARGLLVHHIRTVAGRYKGRMHSWDVVNEAVHIEDGRPDGLRTSFWLKLIGEDYLETAFRAAREADPTALLTYNEYGIEGETSADQQKRAAVLLLLRRLRQRNVPIDAIGIQSHIKANAPEGYGPALRRFIQSCREMELEVFVTEIDVDDRELPSDFAQRDVGVAATYGNYLRQVLAEPNVRAVLAWGVDDAQTWLNQNNPRADHEPQRPLLFDRDLREKSAFSSVMATFRTRSAATTATLPEIVPRRTRS